MRYDIVLRFWATIRYGVASELARLVLEGLAVVFVYGVGDISH